MNKSKNRFTYLIVGVFIGILIAFSIVWWQGNNFGEWSLIKNAKSYFSHIFSRHNTNDVTIIYENKDNTSKIITQKYITDQELKNDSAFYDTTNLNYYDLAALDEFLEKYNGHLPDSLVLDSIINSQSNVDINLYNTSEDLVVKSDKLIFSKSFNVPGIEAYINDNPDKLDSLLTDNKSQIKNKNNLKVEFWKSPINYKGYKTSANKLIIFGIDQFDMISFKIMNKTLYLKYMSDYYQIEKTIDFKPLVQLNNQPLISQLNSK